MRFVAFLRWAAPLAPALRSRWASVALCHWPPLGCLRALLGRWLTFVWRWAAFSCRLLTFIWRWAAFSCRLLRFCAGRRGAAQSWAAALRLRGGLPLPCGLAVHSLWALRGAVHWAVP